MNTRTPVAVLFHDLLSELAVPQTIELAHDHAPGGAAGTGIEQPLNERFDGDLEFTFTHASNFIPPERSLQWPRAQ